MRLWYFADRGEESDPISESDLVQLFAQDRLREKTLVWTEGLEDWQPASDFKIFSSANDPYLEEDAEEYWEEDLPEDQEDQEETEWVPPQKTAPKKKPQTVNESIRPWARFFARKIDIALFFLGLDFLYANIGSFALSTPFYQGVFLILGFLCLEPLLLVAFGATPGKLILGLQLHNRNGGSITYSMACARTIKVLTRGLALGIPFIQFFAQIKSYADLNRDGETSWDREEGFVMEYMEFRLWRAVLTAIIVLSLGVITLSFGLR